MVWLSEDIGKQKLLVVGAGGIGCELLKNLILSGFTDLTVIDLDTIDVSNLNRQFLFQKKHVGKSKSLVAKESVLKLQHAGREVSIDARMCSIFLPEFSVPWIKQFKMVLNALDNVKARNHVNRLCIAADIPLIESGTAGYAGECTLIKKGYSPCYECIERPRAKTFPGCTIRNTPTEPIHCIVWAKFLFSQLFGEPDEEKEVSPDAADPELQNGENGESKGNIARINTSAWAKEIDWDPAQLFNKFFKQDIESLLSMSKLWEKKDRKKPKPMLYEEIVGEGDGHSTGKNSMELRTLKENVAAWHLSVSQIRERHKKDGYLTWDKDEPDAMMFVSSAANIRAAIFSIDQKTPWKVKEMAGNIIPAIATVNAVTAGLIVLQAVNIAKGQLKCCREISLRAKIAQGNLIIPSRFDDPNPNCVVCAEKPTVTVQMNTSMVTLRDLKEKICQGRLSMSEPDVEIPESGKIILSSDEDDMDEKMLENTLNSFGVQHGTIMIVEDFQQDFRLTVHVEHVESIEKSDEYFAIIGAGQAQKLAEKQQKDENDRKRALEKDDSSASPAKKIKKLENMSIEAADSDDDLICI